VALALGTQVCRMALGNSCKLVLALGTLVRRMALALGTLVHDELEQEEAEEQCSLS